MNAIDPESIQQSVATDAAIAERAILDHVLDKYGPLMGMSSVADVLGYPSADALEMSLKRGYIDIRTVVVPHRRGQFALAHDVVRFLMCLESSGRPKVGADRSHFDDLKGAR